MKISKIIIISIVISIVCCIANTNNDNYSIKKSKNLEQTISTIKNNTLIIVCNNAKGIGGFKLENDQQKLPINIILKLKYNKNKNFSSLENLHIKTESFELQGKINSKQQINLLKIRFKNPSGEQNKNEFCGTIQVKIIITKDCLEIYFPKNIFANCNTVLFAWIDFYR